MASCPELEAKSLEERRDMVRQLDLCYNCLSPKHKSINCTSQRTCKTCQGKHHTLLHMESKKKSPTQGEATASSDGKVQSSHVKRQFSTVILPTAKVLIKDGVDELIPYRAILDSGSQSSFISE